MRKITFVTVIALIAALFAFPAFASGQMSAGSQSEVSKIEITYSKTADSDSTAMKDWRLSGLWNMTAEIPETVLASGSVISAKLESKSICHNKYDATTGTETPEYMIFSSTGSFTVDGKTEELDPVVDKYIDFSGSEPYKPGEEIKYAHEQTVGGLTYKEELTLVQIGENEMAGLIKLYINSELVAVGTANATRPTWKLAGKWHYKNSLPEQEIQGYTISGEETGVKSTTMKSGELAGKEYFDTGDVEYTSWYTLNGEKFGPFSDKLEFDLTSLGMYNVGDIYSWEEEGEFGDVKYIMYSEWHQVEENKIVGKMWLSFDGGVTKKEVGSMEATRNSGSSSGCNAGASAAMLLFCAIPALFRKKK